jgi:uncharacterized protein YoxC
MDQQTLLVTMAVFTAVAAIALIIQAGFLFGIYKAARGMSDNMQRLMPKIESTLETSRQTIEEGRRHVADITAKALVLNDDVHRMMPKVESILETSRLTIEDGRRQIADIASKASDIAETARVQAHRIDGLMEDATGRAKVQMDRAEMVIDDTMVRVQRTVALVEANIVKPLRQVQGIAAGIRTALLFLSRGRPNPSRATSDEEMFI